MPQCLYISQCNRPTCAFVFWRTTNFLEFLALLVIRFRLFLESNKKPLIILWKWKEYFEFWTLKISSYLMIKKTPSNKKHDENSMVRKKDEFFIRITTVRSSCEEEFWVKLDFTRLFLLQLQPMCTHFGSILVDLRFNNNYFH